MRGMMLHCGAKNVTMHDLKTVTLPENHERFKDKCERYGTVSHDRLVNSLHAMADYAFGKDSIKNEEFALSGGNVYPGARFFGMFRFDFGANETDKALLDGIEMTIEEEKTEQDDIIEGLEGISTSAFNKLNVEQQNIYLNMDNDAAQDNYIASILGEDAAESKAVEIVTVDADQIYPALAVRNSYDRSMSVGAALGYNVFCCDNLCLSGELSFSRKHTIHAFDDVVLTLWGLLQSMKAQFDFDQEWRNMAKTVNIDENQGYEILGRLAGKGLLDFIGGNKSQYAVALKQWQEPTFEVFENPTLWSLENAITFAQRRAHIGRRLESGNAIIRELRDIVGPEWNENADLVRIQQAGTKKATVMELIEVITSTQAQIETEADEAEARVARLAEM